METETDFFTFKLKFQKPKFIHCNRDFYKRYTENLGDRYPFGI